MTTTIKLTKTTTDDNLTGGEELSWTYDIDNIIDYSDVVDSPITTLRIPELGSDEALVYKVRGNLRQIRISWYLHNRDSSAVTGDIGKSITTNFEQYNFLNHEFQPRSINDLYELVIQENSTDVIRENAHGGKLSISASSLDPINFRADLILYVGNVLSQYEADTLDPPTNVSATADTTNNEIDLSWTKNSDSGLTGHTIERKEDADSYRIIQTGVTGESFSDTTVESGIKYQYRIRSENSSGAGDASQPTKQRSI